MHALSKAALIDAILQKLKRRTRRGYAGIDVHLTHRPGERPNWQLAVDGAEPRDVINVYAALSHFDLKEDAT